jgi:hypothetical protein
MPVPTLISQLSTTASLNSPDGAVDVPSSIDDYQRAHAAFIAQLRDRTATDLPNTPAGNITATTVQAAINELDSKKAKVGALASSGITGAAASGANADITSMTAVTSISATGGTAVKGTDTNDSAAAGYVGEYTSASRAAASALALTTGTSATITTLSLTAGDWDVSGRVGFVTATSSTSVTRITAETTTGADFSGSDGDGVAALVYPGGAALNSGGHGSVVINTGVRRFSLSATTTVNLIGYANFGTAGLSAFGSIKARRVR